MFSDVLSYVFSWVVTFMDNHHCAEIFSQDALNWSQLFYTDFQMCSRCAQMYSDDHRCFWLFSRYSTCSLNVLRIFTGFFQDVFGMLRWVLWVWWNLMIISNECMDLNDPKEFADPQLFDDPQQLDDQLEVWTLIIQKSTKIPPSLQLMVFFLRAWVVGQGN